MPEKSQKGNLLVAWVGQKQGKRDLKSKVRIKQNYVIAYEYNQNPVVATYSQPPGSWSTRDLVSGNSKESLRFPSFGSSTKVGLWPA